MDLENAIRLIGGSSLEIKEATTEKNRMRRNNISSFSQFPSFHTDPRKTYENSEFFTVES